ncbi:hypothetical protein R1flu_024895 [Riccia fluitans]|uniref:Uncharacterized protein n=1 Tax=Riccia fluitans TaxID=41844 RepID=A0ABD1XX49_9MARC
MLQLELELVAIFFTHLNLQPDADGWNTFCREVAVPPSDATTLDDFYHERPIDSSITPDMVRSVLVIDVVFIASRFLQAVGYVAQATAFVVDVLETLDCDSVRCHSTHYVVDLGLVFENQIPLYLIRNVW